MCCGGAADRVGTRFARYGRAARRGRARASALERGEIWISQSERGSPCGRGRPSRAARAVPSEPSADTVGGTATTHAPDS